MMIRSNKARHQLPAAPQPTEAITILGEFMNLGGVGENAIANFLLKALRMGKLLLREDREFRVIQEIEAAFR